MMREDTQRVFAALSHIPEIKQFILVGGTAIAIKANHRLSEDLDFCVTTQKLNKATVNKIMQALARDFSVTHTTDMVQQELFQNDGLDLLEHHQAWLVDNVKLTFFCIGVSDDERKVLSEQQVEVIDNVNVMSLDGLFVTKCLALCDRIKTRDIFDLWWLVNNTHNDIDEVFNLIQYLRPHITYESIRYRLLDWDIPVSDEGLESVAPVTFDTVRQELRAMVNELEIDLAQYVVKTLNP
ncbi:MAG: hypothetical protein CTY35_00690 [Methylotenera sp.]|uniref:nucleotidyl transferase AbiEii/AbiGii toxin family protein n=1 Tax=Methylotenera sp. TaxID=2051956 RepID=UPI000D40C913|nr:nucleotidyl transferase AbiEii/AbiGii toxin family protein [Methylotenera sp.]PPC84871.1 MAG: hypothetical protein CTY38_00685 [Methylotenera sp.]PPD02231.1 MAG: hypothetical protein CTY35_00690 [Methylotenera sp.]